MSITIGILISYWINYGTNQIGSFRCAPNIPYTGGTPSDPSFNPFQDVPPGGCTGQSEASWRLPLALQIVPAIVLGIGMIFFPDTPRWLIMKERDEDSLNALSRLRRQPPDSPVLQNEYLEIRASIMLENSFAREKFPNLSGWRLHAAQVCVSSSVMSPHLCLSQYMSFLTTWARFKRLAIGCCVMFFQQFMGCNGKHLESSSAIED